MKKASSIAKHLEKYYRLLQPILNKVKPRKETDLIGIGKIFLKTKKLKSFQTDFT